LSEILELVKDAGGVTISTKSGDPVMGFHLIIRRAIDNQGLAMGPDLMRLDLLNESSGKDPQDL
jgi:hypothetical protein